MIEIKWTKDKEVSGTHYGWDESGELVAAIRKGAGRNDWRVEVSGKRQIFRGNLLRQAKTIAVRVLSGLEPELTPNPFEQEELPETEEQAPAEAEVTEEERAVAFVDRHFPVVASFLDAELCGKRRPGWEQEGPGRHRLPCLLPAGHGGLHRDAFRAEWLESEAGQVIDLRPFTAIVDMIAGTGVLVSPPASEDLSLSEGGASLHDSLRADALRRLLPHGIEALEGEEDGLSLEGVTDDGRKVFSLYVSDCITTEPDFEEVAVSIEALREAAGL
ncbi:hypothetical protein [Streptomyces sp. NPDC018833]|uniref:hypothetical protein n=1 Tax=Streptomyces sp. NPDC018833 TaxID=3365053 RepID=UPI003797450F